MGADGGEVEARAAGMVLVGEGGERGIAVGGGFDEDYGVGGECGLDSLVSFELRNWIRREMGVELTLTQIVGAANLQALAQQIRSQQ